MCNDCERLKGNGLCPAVCEESKKHFKYAVKQMEKMFKKNRYYFIKAKLERATSL